MESVSEPKHSVEVIRNNHVIFTYGYSGLGPILECIEHLNGSLTGTMVRTNLITAIAAKLLVFAQIAGVEANKVTRSALRVFEQMGVWVVTDGIVEGPAGSLDEALERIRDPSRIYMTL